jgi:hypothetical protein
MALTENPYYNPGQYQQDPNWDWTQTPVINGPSGYYETNPQTLWNKFIQQQGGVGVGDTSPYGQFLKSQYTNADQGFKLALPENPNLTLQQYLGGLNVDWRQQFQGQNPNQRGENWNKFGGGVRWVGDV